MPALTVSSISLDVHDGVYCSPPSLCSFQYQIPPSKYFSNMTPMIMDIERDDLNPHCISFVISNKSLMNYITPGKLENHFSALRCGVERIDLDFTQLTMDNHEVVNKVISAINHLQRICNYQLFISVTIPLNSSLKISELHISILHSLLNQYINIGMINILITKDLKLRNISWPEMVKNSFSNVIVQLQSIFRDRHEFPGKIAKYLGLVLDCDIVLNSMSIVKASLRQTFIHGDKKNIHESELLKIWDWICSFEGGQLTLKSYPSNCKHINKFLSNNKDVLSVSKPLPLPNQLLETLLSEDSELPHYESILELDRSPTYRTTG